MKRVLITGGAGFIGHHVVAHLLRETDWDLTLLDRLDASGNLNRLAEVGAVKNPRTRFVFHDLRAPMNGQLVAQLGRHDYVLHLAAATHVDRSIVDPLSFVQDNVVGTCNVLDYARATGCELFVQFSTDEVFGPAPAGVFYGELDRYNSGNPYAASKAGAEELAVAYANTYGLPVAITHTMNVIGERQHPEKFVPMVIAKVLHNEEVTIHADRDCKRAGTRFYIYAPDLGDGLLRLLRSGKRGKWNLVGAREVDNLEVAQSVAAALGMPLRYRLTDFHSSRPGHDLRYALDGAKARAELGWTAPTPFDQAIASIVQWTTANRRWLLA